jgi:hypothetical protein
MISPPLARVRLPPQQANPDPGPETQNQKPWIISDDWWNDDDTPTGSVRYICWTNPTQNPKQRTPNSKPETSTIDDKLVTTPPQAARATAAEQSLRHLLLRAGCRLGADQRAGPLDPRRRGRAAGPLHSFIYVYVYIYIYICIHIYMYISIYIYIYR